MLPKQTATVWAITSSCTSSISYEHFMLVQNAHHFRQEEETDVTYGTCPSSCLTFCGQHVSNNHWHFTTWPWLASEKVSQCIFWSRGKLPSNTWTASGIRECTFGAKCNKLCGILPVYKANNHHSHHSVSFMCLKEGGAMLILCSHANWEVPSGQFSQMCNLHLHK